MDKAPTPSVGGAAGPSDAATWPPLSPAPALDWAISYKESVKYWNGALGPPLGADGGTLDDAVDAAFGPVARAERERRGHAEEAIDEGTGIVDDEVNDEAEGVGDLFDAGELDDGARLGAEGGGGTGTRSRCLFLWMT